MAVNFLYPPIHSTNRVRPVAEGVVEGQALLDNGVPAVALTGRGDATQTIDLGGGVTMTRPAGGVGNAANEAVLAYTGTAILPVTGVDGSQVAGTPVYITSDGTLTLTASGNTLFGHLDARNASKNTATAAAVKIGAYN